MKKNKKIGKSIIALFMIGAYCLPTMAATVSPGANFSANLGCGANEGPVYVSGSNATIVSGGNWCERGGSISVTATAGGAGTATVTLYAGDDLYNVSNPIDPQLVASGTVLSSSSVTVYQAPSGNGNSNNNSGNNQNNGNAAVNNSDKTPPEEKKEEKPDKDSTSLLSALSVDKGKLSPSFQATTTAYEVSLPAGTTKINVDAKAQNAKAKVEGTGAIDLKVGKNEIVVRCIAEDGSITKYTIQVSVSEKPLAYVTYKNKKLGVLNETPAVPKLFTETTIKIDGKDIKAWVNDTLKLTLVYMQNEKDQRKDFYLFDTKSKEAYSIYRPFSYAGKNLVQIDVPENKQKREGMEFTTITLGEQKLPGWKYKDKAFHNYSILYVMDDSGSVKYYQYEKSEDSLQLYSQAAAITQSDYEKIVKEDKHKEMMYWIIIACLAVLCVILLIFMVIFKRKHKTPFKKVEVSGQMLGAEAKSLLHKEE